MIDPAEYENWIDASPPTFPFAQQGPPDEIDAALDALAEAIGRAEGGARKSIASYLAGEPAGSKTTKILSGLTSSHLIAFLDRHKAPEAEVVETLMPGVAASGAADRLARAEIFRRVAMPARMYALQRACDAARLEQAGAAS